MPTRLAFAPTVKSATPAARAFAIGNPGHPYREPWDASRAVEHGMLRSVYVYRAVETIASSQAELPVVVRRGTDEDAETIPDHPVAKLLNARTSADQSAWALRFMLSAQVLLLPQGAFLEHVYSNGGQLIGLYLLPGGHVAPVPGATRLVDGFHVSPPGVEPYTLPADRVTWVKLPHPTDPYRGMTPLQAAGITVEIDWYARLFNRNFLLNDGRPGGILAIHADMEPEDQRELKRRFLGPTTSMQGAGRISVLAATDGVDFVDTATTPRDAQYLEARKAAKLEILEAFGVPESALGNAADRKFSNAEAEEVTFWRGTMGRHLRLIGDALDALDGDPQVHTGFDTERVPVMEGPRRERHKFLLEELERGAITVEEYRRETGRFGPLPAGLAVPTVEQPKGLHVAPDRPESVVKFGPSWLTVKQMGEVARAREAKLSAWEGTVQRVFAATFDRQARVVAAKLSGVKVAKRLEAKSVEAEALAAAVFDLDTWNRQMAADFEALARAIVDDYGESMAGKLGARWDLYDPQVSTALREQVNRISSVNETTFRTIADRLAIGLEAGATPDQLSAAVSEVFAQASGYRAEMIARTETLAAANSGAELAAVQSGVVVSKTWLAASDHRTREAHAKANGQMATDGLFAVGGEAMEYPGDPNGSAENVINCRCTVVYGTALGLVL